MNRPIVFLILLAWAGGGCLFAQQGLPRSGDPDRLTAAETRGVLRVKGRFLYDSGGKRITLRGVEEFNGDHLDEIAKTGANAYRLIYEVSAGELELVLQKAVCRYNMIVSVGSLKGETWWNRPDVKAVLKKYESHLTLHAYGEAQYDGALPGSDARWLRETIDTVKKLRGYGYLCPLEILADSWGQNIHVLLKHGREVVAADPEHNILLGCQMYSATRPDGPNGMSIETALARIEQSGLPVLVGACAFTDANGNQLYGAPPDGWRRVWRGTYDHGISCYYWCWSGSPGWLPSRDALSLDGTYGRWSEYGKEICGTGKYALSRTAVKSSVPVANWPPLPSMKIQDLVVGERQGVKDNYINVRHYFSDHEDGNAMSYAVSGISRPDMVSARIDPQDNLDLTIVRGSFGTCRITVTATDSGGRKADNSFSVRIRDPRRKNIARGRPVRVSSVKDGLAGSHIADGDDRTRWGSQWKNNQWAVIDLGARRMIDAFTLHWEAAFASSYELQVSTDQRTWRTVYTERDGLGGIEEFMIKPVPARYVRLAAKEAATPWGFSLWEWAVYERPAR